MIEKIKDFLITFSLVFGALIGFIIIFTLITCLLVSFIILDFSAFREVWEAMLNMTGEDIRITSLFLILLTFFFMSVLDG